MSTSEGSPAWSWLTPRWLGLRLIYLLALLLAVLGTHLPSALSQEAARPLPSWHLALFIGIFFLSLLAYIPVTGAVQVNAGLTAMTAVLLIAGVPATLLMILVGYELMMIFQAARCLRRRRRVPIAYLLTEFASNLSQATIATVAAGVALLPFRATPWDGSRPWPDLVEIIFPLLVLVLIYTILDALCACLDQNIGTPEAVRARVLALVEQIGLWEVSLCFLGLAGAVLYTTHLFWMVGLMAVVIFLQLMYGRHVALLQAAGAASDSLRQAVESPSPAGKSGQDGQEDLARYSKLAAERLASDRALLAYKDEVVSLLAHDLRNPLAAISGFASLLHRRALARPGGEEDARDIQRVLAQAKHMATLLDLLMVSSRGTADLFGVNARPVDLGHLVSEVVDQVRLGATDFHWSMAIDHAVPVNCDPDRIAQVVTNLLRNAVKYAPSGSTITITLQACDGEAILAVRDQGIGVPDKDRDRIFQRFERGSNVTGAMPGLGAGLYIVSRIVGAHAGRVWLENNQGKGATFFVALPLCRERVSAASAVGES